MATTLVALAGCSDPIEGTALKFVGEGNPALAADVIGGGDTTTDVLAPDVADAGDVGPDTAAGCTSDAACEGLVALAACQVAVCLPDGTCAAESAEDGAACDDGDACTGGDVCTAGVCAASENLCPCEADADCAAFENGDACDGTLVCSDGNCTVDAATVVVCTSDDACLAPVCDPGSGSCGLVPAAPGTACDDGDACTSGDVCTAGACGGAAVTCAPSGPCVEAACDPEVGCTETALADGVACDDGNPCSAGDLCAGGACVGGASTCACTTDADCTPFQPNACLPALVCVDGACEAGPGAPVACPPSGDPCAASACDASTGACTLIPAADGTPCGGAADACVAAALCEGGECVATPVVCDDGNPCTTDVCDAVKGCGHVPAAGACDDGNVCSSGDACQDGACVGTPSCECADDTDCEGAKFDRCLGAWSCSGGLCVVSGPPVSCVAEGDGPCAPASCDPATGACVAVPAEDGTGCDDGDPCREGTVCTAGVCGGGAVKGCDDGNPCTTDVCQAGKGCVHTANQAPCSDGNACTVGDTCGGGVCKPGAAAQCPAGGACTVAACDVVKGCGLVPKPAGTACDDGNPCSSGDACVGGVCEGESTCACDEDADCADDGDLCNGVPRCQAGACVVDPATVVVCAPEACKTVTCEPKTGKCGAKPVSNGAPCAAGVCQKGGTCQGGTCHGTPVDCDDGNPCTADTCDPGTGACGHAPVDGTACDDGDPCSVASVCESGACVPSVKLSCDDGNACTSDTCAPGVGCQSLPAPCDDGNACTVSACDPAGGCKHTAKLCPPGGACTVPTCDPASGQCGTANAADGTVCADGDTCTAGDVCAGGTCKGQPVGCDDGDACTTDACAGGQCVHVAISGCGVDPQCEGKPGGAACDDGNAVTVADMCIAKKCRGFGLHRANGDALEYGHVGYHAVDHAIGKWHVVGSGTPVWGGGATYAIVDATTPAAPVVYGTTYNGYAFRDLHGGYAVDANTLLWRFDGTSWTANSDIAKVLYQTGAGSLHGVWSRTDADGVRSFWVVGQANSLPWQRRCTEAGGGSCTSMLLGTTQSRLPRAITGFDVCGVAGCTPQLALGADQSAGNGLYYNHVYDNPTGVQSPWSLGYNDTGAAETQTTALAAYGDGRFILVGTGGLLRFRSAAGTWGNTVSVQTNQASRTFTDVWIGADVVLISAWRATSSQRVFELWAAAREANGTTAANWTVYQLGADLSGSAALSGVHGRADGTIYAVGTGRGSDLYLDGLLFTRIP